MSLLHIHIGHFTVQGVGGVLTIDGTPGRIWFGVVGHTADELRANALAVLLDSVYLRHSGWGVCAEDGLAVFPAVSVSPCIAAAHRAHCKNTPIKSEVTGFLKLKQKQKKSTQNQNIKIPVQHVQQKSKKRKALSEKRRV